MIVIYLINIKLLLLHPEYVDLEVKVYLMLFI